jgi:hypothetical protein
MRPFLSGLALVGILALSSLNLPAADFSGELVRIQVISGNNTVLSGTTVNNTTSTSAVMVANNGTLLTLENKVTINSISDTGALNAIDGGKIEAIQGGLQIATSGSQGTAASATFGGIIMIKGATMIVPNSISAVSTSSGGQLTVSEAVIEGGGGGASADSSSLSLTDVVITTGGRFSGSAGLRASSFSIFTATDTSVTIAGSDQRGASVEGSTMNLLRTTILTTGDDSTGLQFFGAQFSMEGGSVETKGAGGQAILLGNPDSHASFDGTTVKAIMVPALSWKNLTTGSGIRSRRMRRSTFSTVPV